MSAEQPATAEPVVYPIYAERERCFAIVSWFGIGSFRADCWVNKVLGGDEYEVTVLVVGMMQDPQRTKRHAHRMAKLDDPDKWPRR